MIERWCDTIARQIALFLACVLVSIAILSFTGFVPSVRISVESFARGIGAGLLLTIVACVLVPLSEAFGPFRAIVISSRPLEVVLGRAVVLAFGEELLLRGFIFAALSLSSFWAALVLNFALAFLLGISRNDGRRGLFATPLARAVEGTFCALLYSWNRALFVVVIARALREVLIPMCLGRSDVAAVLERPTRRLRDWIRMGVPRGAKPTKR